MLCDYTYIKYLLNQRQKVGWWLSVAEGRGKRRIIVKWIVLVLQDEKCSGGGCW